MTLTLKETTIFALNLKKQRYQPQDQQALGWYVTPPSQYIAPHQSTIIWKAGGHTGFTSWLGFSPSKAVGVLIVANTDHINNIEPAGFAIISQQS